MNNNNNNDKKKENKWLGFSLSPYVKMEASPSTSLFHVSPDFGLDYETLHCSSSPASPSLSLMPLNSDGSLCFMEALSKSHPAMVSSPKLEDFFGCATAPSLANMLYHHDNHHHHQHQHQHQHQQQQHYASYFSPLRPPHVEEDEEEETMALELPKDAPCNFTPGHAMSMMMMGHAQSSVGGRGDLEPLSLSMDQWSSMAVGGDGGGGGGEVVSVESKKRGCEKIEQKQVVHRKSLDTFGQRTSQYRGVTRHRWTGRYEAHLWDNSVKKEGQSRKGRQVYLGGYDMEDKAARAYDLAALKYWGPSTHINFPLDSYQKELEDMKNMTRQEFVAHLRRRSSGFSRGASIYRGVTRHHQHGRWQARIGRVAGNKDLYLGTFSTQEEAAEAYDVAAIKFRGLNAVTNFEITRYDVDRIMTSNTLLAGELAKRTKIEDSNPMSEKSIFSSKNMEGDSENMMTRKEVEDLGNIENRTLSNASSLVTSLSSSREGSPDKSGGAPSLFGMPPLVSKFFASPMATTANSWVPLVEQRPSISMPHMPIFAAWTDI